MSAPPVRPSDEVKWIGNKIYGINLSIRATRVRAQWNTTLGLFSLLVGIRAAAAGLESVWQIAACRTCSRHGKQLPSYFSVKLWHKVRQITPGFWTTGFEWIIFSFASKWIHVCNAEWQRGELLPNRGLCLSVHETICRQIREPREEIAQQSGN